MVLFHIWGSFEELCPVFVIHQLSKYIMHMFPFQSQLAILLLLRRVLAIVILLRRNGVSGTMAEYFMNH
jgi:hypothetical protein